MKHPWRQVSTQQHDYMKASIFMLPFHGACLVLSKSTKALPLFEIACPFRAAPENHDKI